MKKEIELRVIKEADYLLMTKETVRDIAQIFKVSKSTVHKDLQERLKHLNYAKYQEVEKIFQEHIQIRHLHGGEKTKLKYQKQKEQK